MSPSPVFVHRGRDTARVAPATAAAEEEPEKDEKEESGMAGLGALFG